MVGMWRQIKALTVSNFSFLSSKVKCDRSSHAEQYLVIVMLVPAVLIAGPVRPNMRPQALHGENRGSFIVGHRQEREYGRLRGRAR